MKREQIYCDVCGQEINSDSSPKHYHIDEHNNTAAFTISVGSGFPKDVCLNCWHLHFAKQFIKVQVG